VALSKEPVSVAIRAAFRILVLLVSASAPAYPLLVLGPNIFQRPWVDTAASLLGGIVIFATISIPLTAGCLVLLLLLAQRGKASSLSIFLDRIAFVWYIPLGFALGIALGTFVYYRAGPQAL
jgi:hypothetical protein